MELKPEDLVITTYRAPWQSHSGWSTVTEAGVSIVHRPTGAMVKVDTEANQHLNRNIAMEMLTTKVKQIQAQKATKATGTAGELPPMVDAWYHGITEKHFERAMYAYGQRCAEAARQPAPVLSDEQIDKTLAKILRAFGSKLEWYGPRELAEMREAIAATNRSQP